MGVGQLDHLDQGNELFILIELPGVYSVLTREWMNFGVQWG
jgi:hypothetical protein